MCDEKIIENKIIYCYYNNVWFVGDNSTKEETKATAVESDSDVKGELIIPKLIQNHAITQIAFCAFFRCIYINKVIINADISVLNYRSFSQIPGLDYIRLPSSIEYIYKWAIDMYEFRNENHTPEGITVVVFQRNTHLKYISSIAFNRRTFIVICIGNDIIIPNNPSDYYGIAKLIIKSPNNKMFLDLQSEPMSEETYLSLCGKFPKETNNYYLQFSNKFVFISIYLLYTF